MYAILRKMVYKVVVEVLVWRLLNVDPVLHDCLVIHFGAHRSSIVCCLHLKI